MHKTLSAWIRKASDLLDRYKGDVPFHHNLKGAFSADTRMGSRDRRMVRAFCYALLRCRSCFDNLSNEQTALAALFLTQPEVYDRISSLQHGFLIGRVNDNAPADIEERINTLTKSGIQVSEDSLFAEGVSLSEGIILSTLRRHQLLPLPVWLRVRRGKLIEVKGRLEKAGFNYRVSDLSPNAIALPPQTELATTGIIEDGLAEVQDIGSQLTLSYSDCTWQGHWLDAFAGAGGKSLLLLDEHPGISLSVSDLRKSALQNLESRFKRQGFKPVSITETDYTSANNYFGTEAFDGIIADVPCTGSGTWARTPEDRLRFEEKSVEKYYERQKTVCIHLLRYLKPGGFFIYITCSVFRDENESVVSYLEDTGGLQKIRSVMLDGAKLGGDYLFSALLKKKGA
jgi:16S rRNA (cytosine967-C5)-methyltransferase